MNYRAGYKIKIKLKMENLHRSEVEQTKATTTGWAMSFNAKIPKIYRYAGR